MDGSGRKMPRAAHRPDKNIDITKSTNWASFGTAVGVASTQASFGIGFTLGAVHEGPTFSGVDLDKCRNPETGKIEDWAWKIIRFLNSYTEISPSGTGVKIFMTGSLPDDARQGKVYKVEIYDRGRYFAVTGLHLESTPDTIEPREDALRVLHEETWSRDVVRLCKQFGFYISETVDWVNVHCPWEANHSGANQPRDAGFHKTAGKVDGFSCFHAGCSEKTLGDVRTLFGLKGGHSSDFVTNKDGDIIANHQENIRRALKLMGVSFEHDLFSDKMYLLAERGRRLFDDAALDRLYLVIDDTYHFRPSFEFFTKVILDIARAHPVHPVIDYLNGLVWDQTPRLDSWLITYGGADDTELTRVVGAKILLAAVRRVRQPGCKFDEMLVLESGQGKQKSSALAALCPFDAWFSDDLPLNVDAKQIIERTSGKWVVEASDLSGMRKSEVEQLKAMLSRQVDGPVRMAYGRIPQERPRSFIVIGTTNSRAYLMDSTGNRRFWPVTVQTFDVVGIRRDRDQLWAEAAHREAQGESIRLDQRFYDEMGCLQEERRIQDPWEDQLRDSDIEWGPKIPVDSIWAILGVTNYHDSRLAPRIYQLMQKLGYPLKRRVRFSGRLCHCWIREDEAAKMGWKLEPESERPDFIPPGQSDL